MAQEQDPYAKWRMREEPLTNDPYAKWKTDKAEEVEEVEEPTVESTESTEIQPQVEEDSWLSNVLSGLTYSPLPEKLPQPLNPRTGLPEKEPENYAGGFIKGLGDYFYEDIVRPSVSPLGAGLAIAGGPIIRGGVKLASKIPGVSKLSQLLQKEVLPGEAPELVKKITKSLTPKEKISTPEASPAASVVDDTVTPLTEQPQLPLESQTPQLKPAEKLFEAIKAAKPLEEKQASIYTKEKAAKMTEVKKVKAEGLEGHIQRKSKLAGEHTKVTNEPLKLESQDVDDLFNQVKTTLTDEFQAIHAGDGLQKILAGQVPQKSELALLERVFGPEISKLPATGTRIHLARLGADVSRAMNTIHDLSMPFRQGIGAISDKSWWQSWVPMVKAFGSQESANGAWQAVLKHEFAQPKVVGGEIIEPLYKRIGLALIDPANTASLGEARGSTIVEKYIPGAKASNRAAATFLNKVRSDMTNRLLSNLRSAGYDIEGKDIDFSRRVANFVNNATGRGSNKYLEKYSNFMNDMLFSPRLQYSRFHMLNPKHYLTANTPEGRIMMKQYWKSAAGIAGTWLTGLKLLEEGADFDVNWTDPSASNFLKATKGNISVDPGASFGQILTLMYRLGSGGYKTLSGREREYGFGFGTNTMKDAIEDFVSSKLAPVPKFAWDALNAQEKFPFNTTDRTIRLVVPLIYQDLSEIAQEDPNLMWLLGPSAGGVGVSNWQSKDLFGESDIIPDMNLPVKRGRR